MAQEPKPTATFQVTSGAVCFGANNNIRYGAQQPIQSPHPVSFEPGGTVLFHSYEYNLAAVNGEWNAYALVVKSSQRPASGARRGTTAWFVCHQSIAQTPNGPYQEAQRILQIANSPYEEDNPTNRNTDQTWEGRVLVINRYDWMYYDKRNHPEPTGETQTECGDYVSLVDHAQASAHHSNHWYQHGRGVQLQIDGEYSFGRFGLTEDRSRVHSFLYFSANTPLSDTVFVAGEEDVEGCRQQPIYIPLTKEERHAKRIADGSYTGFAFLRMARIHPPNHHDGHGQEQEQQQPLLGPFHQTLIHQTILSEVLRASSPHCTTVEPQLQDQVLVLVNELLCCWVFLLAKNTARDGSNREAWMEKAFPQRHTHPSVDSYLAQRIQDNNEDTNAVAAPPSMEVNQEALQTFLGPSLLSSLWTYCTAPQLGRAMRYLLGEVLELAGNCARDSRRNVLVPRDVRMAVANDKQLLEKFGRTKVFYPPDMWGIGEGEAW